jgi:hypothetical protein
MLPVLKHSKNIKQLLESFRFLAKAMIKYDDFATGLDLDLSRKLSQSTKFHLTQLYKRIVRFEVDLFEFCLDSKSGFSWSFGTQNMSFSEPLEDLDKLSNKLYGTSWRQPKEFTFFFK